METYSLRVNEYTDLSWTEFASTYLCLAIPYQSVQTTAGQETIKTQTFWKGTNQKAPDAIDWRAKGLVRRVKNQDSCAIVSAVPFATTAVVAKRPTQHEIRRSKHQNSC
ncbi:hypothetical protein FGIG_07486 [Fasciola gigantica]|uniref:Uncharacterized protein n=1 Tax=Fasciola gigantica TaxID=46835 RepID=A0A504YID9_FASGI|nr:hypothetical protein FGIG_07486 [Fasciola gigantica]